MKCPTCNGRLYVSRTIAKDKTIRRYRECNACGSRVVTEETIVLVNPRKKISSVLHQLYSVGVTPDIAAHIANANPATTISTYIEHLPEIISHYQVSNNTRVADRAGFLVWAIGNNYPLPNGDDGQTYLKENIEREDYANQHVNGHTNGHHPKENMEREDYANQPVNEYTNGHAILNGKDAPQPHYVLWNDALQTMSSRLTTSQYNALTLAKPISVTDDTLTIKASGPTAVIAMRATDIINTELSYAAGRNLRMEIIKEGF